MRRQMSGAIVAVAAALALASCAAPAPADDATRDGLRQHVLVVAEASAAGDWHGALTGLDAMASELSAARDGGELSEERFDTIALAMELVRQDLDDAIAAAGDEAERQRLLEEQARLQEQIAQLQEQQNQGNGGRNDDDEKDDDKKGEGGKKDD